jgi:HEAT repeat protein
MTVNPIERCRAVRVAKVLGLLSEVAEEVYQLAHDGEAVVRSTAVGALTELPGATTTRILRAAVNDPDARVQANAIEALDRLNVDDRLPYIRAKLSSSHGRVRANAVRALLRVELREAGEVLLDMLDDSSQAHRLSALWVIERMRLRSVLQRISELSRGDPDERVRRRAQRVFRELGAHAEPRAGSPLLRDSGQVLRGSGHGSTTGGRSVGQVGSA